MRICLLNASNPLTLQLESDVYTDFRSGRASCFDGDKCIKQCRSWHNWTYSLETEFFVYGKENWQRCFEYDAIIVLVNRDIQAIIPLIKKMKMMGKKIAVSFHEGVGDLINHSGAPNENPAMRWIGLKEAVDAADFYVNLFSQMDAFFIGWFGKNKVKFCSHGAPLDWEAIKKYQIPYEERKYDILIGTRTLGQRLSRNTLITLGVANKFAREGKRVLYLSEDGNVRDLFDKMGFNKIEVKQGPLQFEDWLKLIADCKVVAHSDQSLNLGQIMLDCYLMNVACVGSSTHFALWEDVDDGNDAGFLSHLIETHSKSPKGDLWNEIHPDTIKEKLIKLFS